MSGFSGLSGVEGSRTVAMLTVITPRRVTRCSEMLGAGLS